MPVLEFGLMGIEPTSESILDATTPAGRILDHAWSHLTSFASGPAWVYGGVEVEDPTKLWGFFEFESIAQHQEFAKEHGAEAVKDLPKILTHSVFQKHVQCDRDFERAFEAPVTETRLFWFSTAISSERKTEIKRRVQMLLDEARRKGDKMTAISLGWSVETDFIVLDGGDGEFKGAALCLFVVWESLDASKAFQKSSFVEKILGDVGEMGEVLGTSRRLAACRRFGSRK